VSLLLNLSVIKAISRARSWHEFAHGRKGGGGGSLFFKKIVPSFSKFCLIQWKSSIHMKIWIFNRKQRSSAQRNSLTYPSADNVRGGATIFESEWIFNFFIITEKERGDFAHNNPPGYILTYFASCIDQLRCMGSSRCHLKLALLLATVFYNYQYQALYIISINWLHTWVTKITNLHQISSKIMKIPKSNSNNLQKPIFVTVGHNAHNSILSIPNKYYPTKKWITTWRWQGWIHCPKKRRKSVSSNEKNVLRERKEKEKL